jgi:hypothetical protein
MKMKAVLCILWLAAISGPLGAQALAPELATIAMKYKADISALEGQRATAMAQALKPYETALATAEKSATAAGNVAAVGVIGAERVAITKGLMTPGFPPGLPKELQNPRRTYLDAVARIRTAEAPKRQALDGAYLRALTALGAKAAKESELAKQIDAEKQKLIASAPPAPSKQVGKNMVINGTFDAKDSTGGPAGWFANEGDNTFKLARDGTNSVLRANAAAPGYAAIWQDIILPPRARSVTLSGRVRGTPKMRKPGEADFGAKIVGQFLDQQEVGTQNFLWFPAEINPNWKTLTLTQRIPEGMKALRVTIEYKFVTGDYDVDDIEVEFR